MDELIRKQDAIEAVNRALDRETLLNRLVRKVAIDAIRIVPPVQSDVPEMNVGDMISRQAALEMLMAQNVIMDGSEYHNGFNAGVNRAQEVIRNLPPVQPNHNAEVSKMEIVRCKDCKHYRAYAGRLDGYCYKAEWYNRYQNEDDFCSRGER